MTTTSATAENRVRDQNANAPTLEQEVSVLLEKGVPARELADAIEAGTLPALIGSLQRLDTNEKGELRDLCTDQLDLVLSYAQDGRKLAREIRLAFLELPEGAENTPEAFFGWASYVLSRPTLRV